MRSGQRNLLDRFLSLFTEVRPGESTTALVLMANVFLLLTAYYIIKPVREALILAGGGAEIKSYAAAGQAVLLLGAVPLYARLASRLRRLTLITVVTLFFVACLLGFYLLAGLGISLGVPFYLWVGIFNVMLVAQFWSYANDLYTTDQGKRLFAILGFGASSGAVVGSLVTGWLIVPLGTYNLLLVSAVLLLVSLLLTVLADRRERRRRPVEQRPSSGPAPDAANTADVANTPTVSSTTDAADDAPLTGEGAFALLRRNRYLMLIALLMLMANWVNTTGEFILGKLVTDTAAAAVSSGAAAGLDEGQYIGRFYAGFFSVVNAVGLAVQLLLVSRIIKYLGVKVALLLLPAIALGGYLLMVIYPVLSVVRWSKTAENATDYSLQNTVRNVLFLPTSRAEKYKAKQAIDTFFVRAGDVLSALLVYAGTTWLGLSIRGFSAVNLALALVWLAIAVAIGNHFRRLTGSSSGTGSA